MRETLRLLSDNYVELLTSFKKQQQSKNQKLMQRKPLSKIIKAIPE
jgi:hypothetical protein